MADHFASGTSRARRERMLGPDARCRLCGFADVTALQRDAEGIICYECASAVAGRTTVEAHHPLGRANDPATTIGTPGNFHRLLDAKKAAWPEEVRKNSMHDPLILTVQVTLAVRDFASVVAVYAQAIADWLLQLHAALYEQYGATWQAVLGLPPLWGAV